MSICDVVFWKLWLLDLKVNIVLSIIYGYGLWGNVMLRGNGDNVWVVRFILVLCWLIKERYMWFVW